MFFLDNVLSTLVHGIDIRIRSLLSFLVSLLISLVVPSTIEPIFCLHDVHVWPGTGLLLAPLPRELDGKTLRKDRPRKAEGATPCVPA